MSRLLSTLGLLVVLLGLGGYIYWGQPGPSSDVANKQEKLFTVDSTKIEELKVKSESGDVTALKKDNGAWQVVAPIAVSASENDASSIVNGVAGLDVDRVVDENPTDLKEYGLDSPRLEVEFKADGGKTAGKLLVGGKTPTGGNLFAKRDDQKRVVLIGQFNEATFNKSTFDLRNKAIMKFDRAKVDGADLNVSGKVAEFAKANGEWTMSKPRQARADFSALEGLLGHLESLQMKSIVATDPLPADLKKYGLDKPEATVNLHLGSARATLLVGGKLDEATVYVRDSSKPDVYAVDGAAAADFKKAADDYRKKELFDFRAFSATHVEITRNGQTIVLDRVKAAKEGEADTWHRTSPTVGDPERTKVETLLAGLADIRATSFVDTPAKTGLDKPTLTIVAKFDEGKKEERVVFGKNGADVYAARRDDPGASKVDAEKFDEANKNLDEVLKDAPPPAPAPAAAAAPAPK
jgi:hypothetical protein